MYCAVVTLVVVLCCGVPRWSAAPACNARFPHGGGGWRVQVDDVKAIVAQVDANRDGQVDFQEFIAMMRTQDA
jgi:hypothetical protein